MIDRSGASGQKFVKVYNVLLDDKRLSLKAVGLAVHLLSKPDNWEIAADRLGRELKEGRTTVLTALKELERAGYLVREKVQYSAPNGQKRWKTESVFYATGGVRSSGVGKPSQDVLTKSGLPESELPESENPATKDLRLDNLDLIPKKKKAPTVRLTPQNKSPEKKIMKTQKLNAMTLADYITTDIPRRMLREYDVPPMGGTNIVAIRGGLRQIHEKYDLPYESIKAMMDLYAKSPSVWNRNIHPARDFITASTIIKLRNMLTPVDVEANNYEPHDQSQGLAWRRAFGEPSSELSGPSPAAE